MSNNKPVLQVYIILLQKDTIIIIALASYKHHCLHVTHKHI